MAEKVELNPYPVPDGIQVPNLMPYQLYPWNGDGYLAAEVLRLKEAHGLNYAIETGACLGSTTRWLSENFDTATSCEINEVFRDIALARIDGMDNVGIGHGSSLLELPMSLALMHSDERAFVFLDAHWSSHCPLLNELGAIASAKVKPCIVIHDFVVPGTDFGFDKMPDGRPFNMELVKPYLDRIYGEGNWKHNYPTKVEGAKRGWLSVEPC